MRHRTSILAMAAFTTVVLAACGAGSPPGTIVAASAAPSGASTASIAPPSEVLTPSSAPSGELEGDLGGSPVTLTQGLAHIVMTGEATDEFDLTLTSGILIPGSNAILNWGSSPAADAANDSLRIQAPSRAGTYPSAGSDFGAPQISLTTDRVGTAGVPPQFAPLAAECTVTLIEVAITRVHGTLDCHALTSTENVAPIDVRASFSAMP